MTLLWKSNGPTMDSEVKMINEMYKKMEKMKVAKRI